MSITQGMEDIWAWRTSGGIDGSVSWSNSFKSADKIYEIHWKTRNDYLSNL